MATPEIALLLELVLDLKKDISDLKTESTENKATLEEHARRSTASENRLALLEKRDQMLNGFVKISLSLLGVVGSIMGVIEAIRHFAGR